MNAETIKDFLVSLGFSVDDAGAKKFGSVLAGTTANVIKMGLAVEGAALSVVAFTAKIASGLDNLYWASQRTGATVQGIQSIGYAVSQVGGSVDAARSSLESLSRFIRNNPGAEGFLNRLGVQTRDASGNMRDMSLSLRALDRNSAACRITGLTSMRRCWALTKIPLWRCVGVWVSSALSIQKW